MGGKKNKLLNRNFFRCRIKDMHLSNTKLLSVCLICLLIGTTIPILTADIEKNSFDSLTTQEYFGQEWNVDADGPLYPPDGKWSNYENHSIRMGADPYGFDTYVYYKFQIPGSQVENNMQIGIYFCDWSTSTWSGGPSLRIYNYDTNSWYVWYNVGDQDSLAWVWKTKYNSNAYVSNEGYIWVSVRAEDDDDTILDTVAIQYTIVVVAPTVTTIASTDILCNSATLKGNLSNMGGADTCEVWFQYGMTTSYGSQSEHQIKSSFGSFSKVISSLSSGTTYHFRAVASNSAGLNYGSDMTFTTPAFIAEAGGPYNGTKCNPVSFSGIATGGCGEPYTYSWTFGDGGLGTGQNTIYQYTNNGKYVVSLNIKDSQGNVAYDTASVNISTSSLVAFANGLYEGYIGMFIDFQGSAIGGCIPYSYSWKFGDNQTSSQQNPTHTYSKPGIYTVILTVTDNNTDIDIDTTTATIHTSDLNVITGGPYYGQVDVPIQFTGSAFGGTPPYSFSWDFDDTDGLQVDSTLQNPTYFYDIVGIYNVTLMVMDDDGKTDNDKTTATILSVPDLECEQALNWNEVKPGITVDGIIIVKNDGEPKSKLNWEIDSYPDWGTWTFTPYEGTGLTPEDEMINVVVTLMTPKIKSIPVVYKLGRYEEFIGNITIINKDNPSDKEVMPVSITVSKSKAFNFIDFYRYFIFRFPFFEKIIKQ